MLMRSAYASTFLLGIGSYLGKPSQTWDVCQFMKEQPQESNGMSNLQCLGHVNHVQDLDNPGLPHGREDGFAKLIGIDVCLVSYLHVTNCASV